MREHARITPGAPALIGDKRNPLTYRDLVSTMERVHHRLNVMGFGRGNRIATVGDGDDANAALVVAVWDAATAVPMNPALSAAEFATYFRSQQVEAVAVDAGLDTSARAAARDLGLPVLDVIRIAEHTAGLIDIRPMVAAPAGLSGRVEPEELAMVLLTSGTSSHSKIVPVLQRQLALKADRYARALRLTPADRCLNLMPLFHGHGLQGALAPTLLTGGAFATPGGFSTDGFFRLLGTLAPTWYTGSYTFHLSICAAARDHAGDIEKSRLRAVRVSSGRLDPAISDELERRLGALVLENYSCSEVSLICSAPLPPAVRKRGTVGRPLPGGNEVAIMGPDGRILPAGERGEVVVRSADVFSGYENDDDANAECFVAGWYRTGDEGVFDSDGHLTLTGRIKEMINRGGEKISPTEVDAAMMAFPGVREAICFPVPHPSLGEEVAAVVVLEPGAELSAGALRADLVQRIAGFKVPKRIIFAEVIPKNATGKPQRRTLADFYGVVVRQ